METRSLTPAHPILMRDLTEPDPIPVAGQQRALELLQSGRLFRYGEAAADQQDTALLEDEFAEFVGRKYCIAVNSGGCALFLAMMAVGVKPGDAVLVNGFTLAPVPGAIAHAGARAILVEIGANYVIDIDDLAMKARTSNARVLLLSHMRGHIANMDAVAKICAAQNLIMIEDCAHAICAKWRGKAAGTFGAVGCFSTQTYKHLNSGEGGLIVTDDDDVAARTILHSGSYMLYRQHLRRPPDAVFDRWSRETPNFSMRMTALAAAVLRPQLAELPQRVTRWNAIYQRICSGLARLQMVHVPRRAPDEAFSATSVQFSLLGLAPDQIMAFLDACRVRGLNIKWFGGDEPVGFTSAPRHWAYVDNIARLEQTHQVLAGLCDIRTPVSLTDDECDVIVAIISEVLSECSEVNLKHGATKV